MPDAATRIALTVEDFQNSEDILGVVTAAQDGRKQARGMINH
jgi:hypothetical protein